MRKVNIQNRGALLSGDGEGRGGMAENGNGIVKIGEEIIHALIAAEDIRIFIVTVEDIE